VDCVDDLGVVDPRAGAQLARRHAGSDHPAYAANGARNFPVKTPLHAALASGIVRHSGGSSLTAGSTTVGLTNFDINVPGQVLTAQVNGGARRPDRQPRLVGRERRVVRRPAHV